jgi:transposase-like protein
MIGYGTYTGSCWDCHAEGLAYPSLLCAACWQARDIDDVAVERLTTGDPVATATRAERRAAVHILLDRGVSQNETARRVGMSSRQVARIATDRGMTGALGEPVVLVQARRARTSSHPPYEAGDTTTPTDSEDTECRDIWRHKAGLDGNGHGARTW